ncbi:MAG: hypothetical protein Q9M91_02960 [Candidatus Dojkabacteria bacterium]|nr:hypothetical protein [Candidatus Dojkabacteria bacterium]MDQ7020784.1 hypothetical protein [Candidatus Dojkabacteria bacterium]
MADDSSIVNERFLTEEGEIERYKEERVKEFFSEENFSEELLDIVLTAFGTDVAKALSYNDKISAFRSLLESFCNVVPIELLELDNQDTSQISLYSTWNQSLEYINLNNTKVSEAKQKMHVTISNKFGLPVASDQAKLNDSRFIDIYSALNFFIITYTSDLFQLGVQVSSADKATVLTTVLSYCIYPVLNSPTDNNVVSIYHFSAGAFTSEYAKSIASIELLGIIYCLGWIRDNFPDVNIKNRVLVTFGGEHLVLKSNGGDYIRRRG